MLSDKSLILRQTISPVNTQPAGEQELLYDSKIEYGWERSFPIIKKYTNLIDERFRDEINIEDTYKKINDNDFSSYFYIAKTSDEIVSGVRVSISPPRSEFLLPTEKNHFSYKDAFPKLDLYDGGYCEITRYAVSRGYRNNPKHYVKFFAALKKLCQEKNIKYIFLLVSKGRLKLYSPFVEKHFSFADALPYDVSDWSGYEEFKYAKDFNFVAFEYK